MSLGDISLSQTSIVVDELVATGMEHACIAPGSRSTPIVLALERDPRVTVHVHLDERASAFFALGIAKATRRPVGVACTSGTAAANLLPAIVEASQSRVTLVLLTADRPPRFRGTGANQTIDQVNLYGRYARAFVELPLPAEPVPEGRVRSLMRSAFRDATPQGPIHLNLPFDEPLTPEGAAVDVDPTEQDAVAIPEGFRRPIEEADAVAREVAGARGVVIVGSIIDSAPTQLLEEAERLKWAVIAEPPSGSRLPGLALAAGQAVIGSGHWLDSHRPEVVLQIGATPTARTTQRLVASAERLVVIDVHHPDPDPESRASLRIHEDPEQIADELAGRPHVRPGQPMAWYGPVNDGPPSQEELLRLNIDPAPEVWIDTWHEADAAARRAMDELYDSWDEPFEGRVARDLAVSIPNGGTLVVGSSMPIRDLDYSMAPRDGLRILANRGASGIDGFVSTVLGVAATGAPTFALCGDLTFLHDVGSLLWSAGRGHDAVFVVVNNDGGAIFDFLPQRELPEHERLFTTPHGLDLSAVCAAAGANHVRIEHGAQLMPAVVGGAAAGGVRVIEVPSNRARNVERHADVQRAVDDALARM